MKFIVLLIATWQLHSTVPAPQKDGYFEIHGAIRDSSGAAVPGAQVTLTGANFERGQTTDEQGYFGFDDVPITTATISVKADGFAVVERKWEAYSQGAATLVMVLTPAPLSERIAVTATLTPQRVSDTAESITILAHEDLATAAALTLDGALRQVPGFALFRRTGSLTSNPTSQGVSLRGSGSSGASRAIVLDDGLPLNDPFGGWVYWDRVPKESIEAVEVVQGGMSNLYGTGALGGVINIIPHRPHASSLSFETSLGTQETLDTSFSGSLRKGGWLGELSAGALRTDGYIPVNECDRGTVDTPARSEYTTARFTLGRMISEQTRIFGRGSVFQESRNNGTHLQTNQTHLRQITVGVDWQSAAQGTIRFRAYGGPQLYDQTFSAIALDRNSETLTRIQRVPSQQVGGLIQWSRPLASRQALMVGLEAQEVRGASDELVYAQGLPSSVVGVGGRQRGIGFFAEDIIRLTPGWLVTAAVRYDSWRNQDGLSAATPLAPPGPVTAVSFPARSEQAFSPRLGVVRRVTDHLILRASGYRAFRAPTLNELYRSFRVGNLVTLANHALSAERLTGVEAGASYSSFAGRLTLRGSVFGNVITQPVANVTLDVQPNLIIRQRQNLGSTRQRGIELDFEAVLTDRIILSGGYQFVDSVVRRFPANPVLEGLLIPHVPRSVITFQARYSNPRSLTIGLQQRFVGMEFDDDQNLLQLRRYSTLDAFVSRPLSHHVEVFAVAENLFNQRCDVGRTPVLTIGPPLSARIGLRLHLQ